MRDVLALLKTLISKPSLTPDDAGCQALIIEHLSQAGFECETLKFGEVENLWARFGTAEPLLVFAGHTDVVPTGPEENWHSPPFTPTIKDDYLYGRGATDMKSGLSAMIIAALNFIDKHPTFHGSIAFLVTSDEEGPGVDGTVKVIETLSQRNVKIDYCIVGEATSENVIGDQIRIGRRGSFHGALTIHGKQGHVAFPHLALNPIHQSAKFIDALTHVTWDQGNQDFPPTTLQISNMHAGTGAANVIPGGLNIQFNLRFSTAISPQQIQMQVIDLLNQHGLQYKIDWHLSAKPFLTQRGTLIVAAQKAITAVTGVITKLSTGGGTSDARFIAPTGAQVIELGPVLETAHQANERVRIDDLKSLLAVYEEILAEIFLTR